MSGTMICGGGASDEDDELRVQCHAISELLGRIFEVRT
jgi:hypothetical protein